MAEDDEVRQVRAGQEERAGVREQQASVEEGRLSASAAARRVDEHRGEERDGGVEVQHGGDQGDQERRSDEQGPAAARGAAQQWPAAANRPSSSATSPISRRPVTSTNGDQTWAAAARAGRRWVQHGRRQEPEKPDEGQGSADESLAGAGFRGRSVI